MIFENRMNVNDDKDGNSLNDVHHKCELNDISNEPPGGMHQTTSVMMVSRNFPMSHLAGCTNRYLS